MQPSIEAVAPARTAWGAAWESASRAALPLALVLAAALPATSHAPPDPPTPRLLARLSAALPAPPLAPRLSIATRPSPCASRTRPDETIPRAECAAPPPSRALSDVAVRAGAARGREDPAALHALGLIELASAGPSGNRIDASIAYLRRAAQGAPRSARVLADLSAAHLLRAEVRQSAGDLVAAVQIADSAVSLDPRSAAARYNLALALDRFALDREAAEGWRGMLTIDSTSAWADEARRRLKALTAPAKEAAPPPPGAPTDRFAAYARRAPQGARQAGWNALGGWSRAFLGDSLSAAADSLALAEALGTALERQGGDRTLADAVRAVRARRNAPAELRRLARAHRSYAEGLTAALAPAERLLAEAAATSASPALAQWAASQQAVSLVYLNDGGRRERGERMMRELLARVDAARNPALAGRLHWTLATTIARTGRYEEAVELHRRAAALFDRAGEWENLGTVQGMAAEILFKLGRPDEAYAIAQRSLTTLRPYPSSTWRHIALYAAARGMEGDGSLRAALRVQDEDLAMAREAGGQLLAEAYLARARLRTAAGLADSAAADRRLGQALADSLNPQARAWFQADVGVARASALLPTDPAAAGRVLNAVVAYFDAGLSDSRLAQALVLRSRARLALGDLTAAAGDLERVLDLLDEQRAAMGTDRARALLAAGAREVFDRIVMVHVAAGRPEQALHELERGRTHAVRHAGARGRVSAPPGQTGVVYALIGDTLLTWTVAGASVYMERETVDADALLRAVHRADSLLERGEADGAVPALRSLYDRLIRPVEARLGPDGTPLVLVADGPLADVPFAALHDARRTRYLVQAHPTRVMGSLRDALHTAPARGPPRAPLLVADPAFDPRAFPQLARLRGAAAEVDSVAARYPAARVVRGAAATRQAVAGALARADVVHFAGHAVADAERPEGSHLVLAPAPGDDGRLTAREIERLELGGVRLVVLSACRTQRGGAGRTGGLAGLSGAFLAAGARGVVGTLWRVEDGSTRALMTEFHRAYGASGDAAAALREAQLRLIRSGDPALRSPAAWAAFRYSGS